MLPTCWVHERKHKVAKRYGADSRNTRIYGLSVLSECVSHQLVEVLDPDAFDVSVGIIQRTSAPKKVGSSCWSRLNWMLKRRFSQATLRA